ncbi:unnamed protein product [Hermetia illucens]|uniref:Uncharacterized protein n=1 Tax=Hermetia illucens TaxID=343691 RepID=A0A7R8UMH7_HERIL|nr:unnamed protein product [Hermetia illucens]
MSSNIDLAISFHLRKVQELKSIKSEVENLERNALGFVCRRNDGKYEDLITGDDVLDCLERVKKKIKMNEERLLQLNIHKMESSLSVVCSFEEDYLPEDSIRNMSHLMVLQSYKSEPARNSECHFKYGNATARSSRAYPRHSFKADRTAVQLPHSKRTPARCLSPLSIPRKSYMPTRPAEEHLFRPVPRRASYRDGKRFISLELWNRQKTDFFY